MDEIVLGVTDEFDVLLEDEDDIRQAGGLGNGAVGEGVAEVEAEEQFIVIEA